MPSDSGTDPSSMTRSSSTVRLRLVAGRQVRERSEANLERRVGVCVCLLMPFSYTYFVIAHRGQQDQQLANMRLMLDPCGSILCAYTL